MYKSRNYVMTIMITVILIIAPASAFAKPSSAVVGAVYTMGNNPYGNSVIAYNRQSNGILKYAKTYLTGGKGMYGIGGSNQEGLVISGNGRWLFAINAGSNDVSVFEIKKGKLLLTDRVNSGGIMPLSISSHGDVVYVLNGGAVPNITGFRLSHQGRLYPIPKSVRLLSGKRARPAQVSFSPSGNVLVVTEKNTNIIDVFHIYNGIAAKGSINYSVGASPFGFDFDTSGRLVVSEAAASSVSSYVICEDVDRLVPISFTVVNKQKVACWLKVTRSGKLAFAANSGTHNISSYSIGPRGKLMLLKPEAAKTGIRPIDLSLSINSKYLYNLSPGSNSITGYKIESDGGLKKITTISGIPEAADGLAAY